MKQILFISSLVAFISCTKTNGISVKEDRTDALIQRSELAIKSNQKHNNILDSVTTETIRKTTETFNVISDKLKTQEASNQRVKILYRDRIIHKVDTVLVETKKNFWGRKSTKVSTVSNESTQEQTDSTTTDY